MISEAILIAIITGSFTLAGQYIISRKNRRDDEIKAALRDQKVDMRLGSIETKLDIHNGYAEKFGQIEKSITAIETRMHVLHPD